MTHSGTVVSGTAESGGRQRRSQAAANRNRIIEAAITAFAADPDASMDDVAKAAGVVRRTVYAYFDSREALINGIVDEASTDLVAALSQAGEPPERPDLATAVLALLSWPVGDRFRMLLSFARKELGEQRILDLMEPARAVSISVVERGQRDGTFSKYLPAETLVAMTEAITITLFDQANSGSSRTRANPLPPCAWSSRVSVRTEAPRSSPKRRSGSANRCRPVAARIRPGRLTSGPCPTLALDFEVSRLTSRVG